MWIKCDLEGNDEDMTNGECFSSSVEMDVLESVITDLQDDSINGSSASLSSNLIGSSSNRVVQSRKPRKLWKRRYYLQQRARQERLNCSRKWKNDGSLLVSTQDASGSCESCNDVIPPESLPDGSTDIDLDDKELVADNDSSAHVDPHNCECVALEFVEGKKVKDDCICTENDVAQNEHLLAKRHSERDLDNPKPRKSRKPIDRHLDISKKYSTMSFCSIDDHLPDGFYDAGRDRPFLSLSCYEKSLHLGSREVIVMDRGRDEELDSITLCAQDLLFNFYSSSKDGEDDKLQIGCLLALFVSNHFGGSDKSTMVDRARKSVSGSNYNKPFVCTCPTGNNDHITKSEKHNINSSEDAVLGLCEKSLQLIKARRNSIVVPIGSLKFGVCRHRALLMKYLCDRVDPQVPCELVRGYLDFAPHAWNVIVVKRGDSEVRMVVDACRPHDIREEMDPEHFYRYIPLSRMNIDGVDCSFPSLSACDEIEELGSTTLIQCKLGSTEAVAKVRTLDVSGSSPDEIRNFEYNCLGEVRLLSVLKHPCIVKILGHQISTKWLPADNGIIPEHRVLQSAIFMENVKGGSLKHYIEKLARSGEKHVDVRVTLQIIKDVSWALSELHSRDVIHRDLKSENILLDFDEKSDKTPKSVKLCDFDRAIPLRSHLHTCCIGQIHPPDVCVGTPRWMAPEVYRTIHARRTYGMEVDIWSFGCLVLELLTLQVPYSGLTGSEIHDFLLMGKRPVLTDELEALDPFEDSEVTESEMQTMKFLIDIYRQCTKDNPSGRPTAEKLHQILTDFSKSTSEQESIQQEFDRMKEDVGLDDEVDEVECPKHTRGVERKPSIDQSFSNNGSSSTSQSQGGNEQSASKVSQMAQYMDTYIQHQNAFMATQFSNYTPPPLPNFQSMFNVNPSDPQNVEMQENDDSEDEEGGNVR